MLGVVWLGILVLCHLGSLVCPVGVRLMVGWRCLLFVLCWLCYVFGFCFSLWVGWRQSLQYIIRVGFRCLVRCSVIVIVIVIVVVVDNNVGYILFLCVGVYRNVCMVCRCFVMGIYVICDLGICTWCMCFCRIPMVVVALLILVVVFVAVPVVALMLFVVAGSVVGREIVVVVYLGLLVACVMTPVFVVFVVLFVFAYLLFRFCWCIVMCLIVVGCVV